MKIVYCIAGTYRPGGMERVLANKANYLVEQGHEVVIVTTDQRGQTPFFPLDDRIRCYDLDINYEENNGKSIYNKIINFPLKQQRHRRRLLQLLKKEKPQVTVSMFCNEVSFLADLKDGSAKVLEVHFSRFKRLQYGRTGLWKWMDRYRSWQDQRLAGKYSRFVVLTKEDAVNWGPMRNLKVIYNASPFQMAMRTKPVANIALAVGRYTHQKGFDMLIRSWCEVKRQAPDWKLYIVGDGDVAEREKMKQLIAACELKEQVVLLPPMAHIEEAYRNASMVVMSSRYEGLPMSLIEAQSFGLPIVSFACACGPKDIVTDGVDGFLVPLGDEKMLAQRIVELIRKDEVREGMGKQAKLNSRRFEADRIMQQWIKLFNEAYEDHCRISR